jgi:hypothetical protein
MHVRRGIRFRSATLVLLTTALAALTAGCSSNGEEHDYDLLYTNVEPIDFARILCRGVEMRDEHTCLTSVIEHWHDTRYDEPDPSEVTGGPMVVVFDEEFFRGTYVSNPFQAAFTVASATNLCRGRFDAFGGSVRAEYKVRCDDGSTGVAKLQLARDGRNGIGFMELFDGRRGDIVFGHRAVGGSFL